MARIKSIEDLDQIRRQAQEAILEKRQKQVTITVGTGTCGLAAGAGDTLQQIQLELAKRERSVELTTVGCIGMCVKEPLVDVQLPGQARVTYINVKPEMVARILDEHVIGGQPVKEWLIGTIPVEW